jgi:tetratricopeptide (TPR) repeat protein
LNAQLQQQKKEGFAELYQELSAPAKPAKIITLRRIAYLAAASVLLIIGLLVFLQRTTPQTIADKYIAGNLSSLSLNMGVSDSLQTGISAYNSKSYQAAARLFKPLTSKPETAPDALEDLGLTYLAMKQYSDALKNFDELSAIPLHINRGQFYKAVTLMARSEGRDTQQAKKILQEIIDKNLYGNQQARNWIKKL